MVVEAASSCGPSPQTRGLELVYQGLEAKAESPVSTHW